MIRRQIDGLDVELILEPGRLVAANAGVLLSRVLYVKQGPSRKFLILDAGMNDLIRPALYDAWHDIQPVKPDGALVAYDVVGPVCESTDLFARDRQLPELKSGDLVAIMSAGAYGAVQGSSYNARPLAPEILVNGAQFSIVRGRPSYEEMMAAERIAPWL
jgi:diaminopimelate decarboxylase